jgi:hypothetical protein
MTVAILATLVTVLATRAGAIPQAWGTLVFGAKLNKSTIIPY